MGTALRVDLRADGRGVPSAVEGALVRIVQEAITNAGRHGRASEVHVELSNGDCLRLVVADDGVGFDPAAVRPDGVHFGLLGMRERVEALGGRLEIASRPGDGTRIEVALP